MMNEICPCKQCITKAICKARMNQKNSVDGLALHCSLVWEYVGYSRLSPKVHKKRTRIVRRCLNVKMPMR